MKKCAVINDLSGFGKCSLTASIPLMSAMGVEVHPLLTAVLSNQTAYKSFKSLSLTDTMFPFIEEWKKLGASFDGILTGFVTDKKQLEIISKFIDEFKGKNTLVVADPVMADNGALYGGYHMPMCDVIRKFCFKADVITPNTTELAILAYKDDCRVFDDEFINNYGNIKESCLKLYDKGIKRIVVTGYKENDFISNIIFDNGKFDKATFKKVGGYYSGTGDVFASVLTGSLLNGKSLVEACEKAGEFITNTIKVTEVTDGNDGIAFEKNLKELISYE